jgi:hypothetical protein
VKTRSGTYFQQGRGSRLHTRSDDLVCCS